MERVAEKHNVLISYHPKELEGDWNGSGCHTNYSTKFMREGNKKKNIKGIDILMMLLQNYKNVIWSI